MKWALILFLASISFVSSASEDRGLYHMIGQLLNSKDLAGYWHTKEFPDRVPVVVLIPSYLKVGNTDIKMFGKPVVFTNDKLNHKNILSINGCNTSANSTTMLFSYLPEGIQGTAIYSNTNGKWILMSVDINEN